MIFLKHPVLAVKNTGDRLPTEIVDLLSVNILCDDPEQSILPRSLAIGIRDGMKLCWVFVLYYLLH